MRRALLVGLLIALCCAVLGVPLVLRRFAMIGDGLSHTAFAAMSVALAVGWAPLAFALPVVTLASVTLLYLSDRGHLKGDGAIAMISTAAMAIGVAVASLSRGITADISSYLFGSILAISPEELTLTVLLSLTVLGVYLFSFNRIFAISFDEDFAKASGLGANFYRMLLAILTAITVVLGLRLVGALLIGGLIIFPSAGAMHLSHTYKGVVATAAGLAVAAMLGGLAASFYWDLPTGATVVIVNLCLYACCALVGRWRRG
ncbi:metal ABC transporter permease [Peptococcus simiae]|uniref:Metal ABC transporter permease n=1 Tax=Peptococcus simiae TaxID=1643805 RepID=A0ABW9GXS8_9FIRM